jgi:stage III sporulation protein AE
MESVGRILTDVIVSIKVTNVFINAYLPIMAGVLVASRNPALAVTYNSYTIILSNVISVFTDKLFLPIISVLFSFNIISAFSSDMFHLKINKTLRKLIILVLSLFSTVFTGLLTTQSLLASSSDGFVLKGIKFISGAFIPVVGGTVSEAVSSVVSSFIIMKSTLGVFVIIVIILINLPVIIELLVWYFFLSLCSIGSSLFKTESVTEVFDSLASTISLLNIVLFFLTFVLVVSTGIVIMMGR